MGKSTHFLGQPILGHLLNYLNKAIIRRNRQTLWGDGVRMLTQKLVAKRYMIA